MICPSSSLDIIEVTNDKQQPPLLKFKNSKIVLETKNNAILAWETESIDQHYPEKYDIFIVYRSSCDLTWIRLNITKNFVRNGNQFLYAFEKICHNNTNKITLGSESISQGTKYENVTIDYQGLPNVPFVVPQVDVGSFFIDKNNDVHIYWKKIDSTSYNGDKFQINFTQEIKKSTRQLNNQTINQTITEKIDLIRSTTILKQDWFNSSLGVKIKLQAYNDIGYASGASFIEIPPKDHLCGKPENIQVYVLNKTYHVSWTKPSDNSEIDSYTVFYCNSITGGTTQCDSSIDFTTVTEDLKFNITTSNYLKFAVSANTDSSTSGMTWMECLAETDPTKIGQIVSLTNITTSTDSIDLNWEPTCKDRLIVKYYTINYCSVKTEGSNDCVKKFGPFNTSTTTYSLKDLKLNAYYKISVTMHSATTQGPQKDQFFKTAVYVWQEYASYIIVIVFLLIASGVSAYWMYSKFTQMKNIGVNLPFGLDNLEQHGGFQNKTNNLIQPELVADKSIYSPGLNYDPETEPMNVALIDSSAAAAEPHSSRKGSVQSQDSAVTMIVEDRPILQVDSTLRNSLDIEPFKNFIIHPVSNIESSPTLVNPTFTSEWPKDEQVDKIQYTKMFSSKDGSYVSLPSMVSNMKNYIPINRLLPPPPPPQPVIPKHGAYVAMNKLPNSYNKPKNNCVTKTD
ncbi:unnamed protein product [Diamesa serratosioi]